MEEENERSSSKLDLRCLASTTAAIRSPKHYSWEMATPPLHALASVPFKWEEEPGKPRHSAARPEATRCLELPPCRMLETTKTHSPTAVLDGPYVFGRPKFSSFRFLNREARDSLDSISTCSLDDSAVDVLLGKKKTRGFFGRYLRSKSDGTTEVDGDGSWTRRKRRQRSLCSLSQARSFNTIWAATCKSLKQVILWKSARKSSKEGSTWRSDATY